MNTTPTDHLPQPTHDLERAKADIDKFGYCFLAKALKGEQLAALRTRLEEQAEAEREAGLAYEDGGANQNWGDFRNSDGTLRPEAFTAAAGGCNQRVWMLINKGRVFRDLVTHAQVRAVVDHVLGTDYLLSSFTANIAKPGGVAMDLHTDQWWMPAPVYPDHRSLPIGSITRTHSNEPETDDPPLIAPSVAVNVMWMLNDFSAENGGTHLVPGSHLSGRRPDKERDREVETIAAAAPAGTVMVFDGRVWHGTGANVSDGPRLGLLTTFCGPQFRPQENFTIGTAPEVLADASPDLLALLGFKVWNAYGRIENPAVEFIKPGEQSLGEMRPN